MKQLTVILAFITVLILSLSLLVGCDGNLRQIDLVVCPSTLDLDQFDDKRVEIFQTSEQMKNFFVDNPKYSFCYNREYYSFDEIAEELNNITSEFDFDENAMLFVTLNGVDSGTTLQAKRRKSGDVTEITFCISRGQSDDYTCKFFLFEIQKNDIEEINFNFITEGGFK